MACDRRPIKPSKADRRRLDQEEDARRIIGNPPPPPPGLDDTFIRLADALLRPTRLRSRF